MNSKRNNIRTQQQNSKDLIYLNPDCLDFRKRNAGNIIKKRFNAKGNQMFKCKTCGVRFPETKGMVFYNRHLTEEQIIMTYKLLLEKNGVREIERIKEIHRDTVSDVIEDLARHAREVTDYLITNVGLTQIQVDEMWSFVKKSLLLEMQGDIGRSSGSLPVLHQFYPNPFSIDD